MLLRPVRGCVGWRTPPGPLRIRLTRTGCWGEVLGEVSGSVRLLRQVLDQLSRAHADHRDIAFTDDRAPAEAVALAAADELHQAADGLDEVADRVMRAHEASGRIAWHTHTNPEPERSGRWVNVVFLQGSEADEVLDLIDLEGCRRGLRI